LRETFTHYLKTLDPLKLNASDKKRRLQ